MSRQPPLRKQKMYIKLSGCPAGLHPSTHSRNMQHCRDSLSIKYGKKNLKVLVFLMDKFMRLTAEWTAGSSTWRWGRWPHYSIPKRSRHILQKGNGSRVSRWRTAVRREQKTGYRPRPQRPCQPPGQASAYFRIGPLERTRLECNHKYRCDCHVTSA